VSIPIAVVGMSHHTAPVGVRERMAFGAAEAAEVLRDLRNRFGVEEAVLLSTCNRTEIYLYPVRRDADLSAVEDVFARRLSDVEGPATEYLFRREGESVVEHLFSVSAGLDSMVTGEAEIQGQVREAYERSRALAVTPPLAGPVMNRLFQTALSAGGQVRSETSINEGTASVASVAVELARKIFGQLKGKRVLILGAGATAELMVEALAREGVKGILVANRTYDRAVALARRLEGSAVQMDRLQEGLPVADIVLCSTAAPHHILTSERFRSAFPRGRAHPLLVIDIAMPRDVDPVLGEESGVFLYNVDDLRRSSTNTYRFATRRFQAPGGSFVRGRENSGAGTLRSRSCR
jgi:glutamyl-tRNA reductase